MKKNPRVVVNLQANSFLLNELETEASKEYISALEPLFALLAQLEEDGLRILVVPLFDEYWYRDGKQRDG
jgi:hypothetical protein